MAEWRDRDYVPDSDGEEEILALDLTSEVGHPGVGLSSDGFLDIDDVLNSAGRIGDNSGGGNVCDRAGGPSLAEESEPQPGQSGGIPERKPESVIASQARILHGDDIDVLRLSQSHSRPPNTPPAESQQNNRSLQYSSDSSDELAKLPSVKRHLSPIPAASKLSSTSPRQAVEDGLHRTLSSPLSTASSLSLGSSPPGSVWPVQLTSPKKNTPHRHPSDSSRTIHPGLSHSSSQLHSAGHQHGLSDGLIASLSRPTRNFRERKAIQLHPYLLEGEQYRQTLRARGLKPVRIQQEEEQFVSNHQYNGSSPRDETQSFTSEVDRSFTASPPRTDLTVPWNTTKEPGHLSDSDDEFPDLSALMRRVPGSIIEGNKRRKVAHAASKKYKSSSNTFVGVVIDNSAGTTSIPYDIDRLENAPPSPPFSAVSNSSGVLPPAISTFRYPPGFTPVQLHTPQISSEIKQPARIQTDDESDIDPELGKGSQDNTSGSDGMTSETPSDNESVPQLQEVRRKIRGVLPASWLRLDLNAQNRKIVSAPNDQRASESPTKNLPAKGVARPISSYRGREGSLISPLPIEISDDSLSDSGSGLGVYNEDPPPNTAHSGKSSRPRMLHDNNFDIMEDNRIDFMLPPQARPKKSSARGKVQRNSLTTSSRISKSRKDTSLFRRPKGGGDRQRKISEHIVRISKVPRQTAERRAPKLSILDVTEPSARSITPNFLRVAARTAKSKPGGGRHSPSGKYLRLASKQDTDDVQDVLTSWKGGAISRKSQGPTKKTRSGFSQRSPLRERSANNQTRPSAFYLPDEEEDEGGKSSRRIKAPTKPLERRLRENHTQQLHYPAAAIIHGGRIRRGKVTKGSISFSLQQQASSRPAMLEVHRRAHVAGSLARNNERQIRLRDFLESTTEMEGSPDIVKHPRGYTSSAQLPSPEHVTKKRLVQRKRQPLRIDIGVSDVRQETPPTMHLSEESVTEIMNTNAKLPGQSRRIQGLDEKAECSTTFGMIPLQPGLYFDPSSFVGSGLFAQTLDMIARQDLDVDHEPMKVTVDGVSFEWAAWNETVSSELEYLFSHIRKALQISCRIQGDIAAVSNFDSDVQHAISMHRDVIQYVAQSLSFLDPVDRCGFLQRCIVLAAGLSSDLDGLCQTPDTTATSQITYNLRHQIRIQLSMQSLAMFNQFHQISLHPLVPDSLKKELASLVSTKARQIIALVFSRDDNNIRDFVRNRMGPRNYSELGDGHREAEAVVVVRHIWRSQPASIGAFWQEVEGIIRFKELGMTFDVDVLERGWQKIFSLITLMDLDPSGTIHATRNSDQSRENWGALCSLVKPVLQNYSTYSRGQGMNFNAYCRTVLERCLHLLQSWGWQRCEPIIYAFFDFFASIGFRHLNREQAHGSPPFLEILTNNLKLTVVPEDRAFHRFLKLLGTGIRTLRELYSDSKKTSGIVFRVIPNNDHQYPKDQAVSQEDLDALRNHHDLLSVLYWASPPGFRPRLSVIRNLVRIENSHKEACHLSIRTWSNLVNFQISTSEPVSELQPFAEWCEDIFSQVLRLHGFARSEVESQVRAAENSGLRNIDKEMQESIIGKNQRQIEAILADVLISVSKAIKKACTIESAQLLLPKVALPQVLDLFDPKHPRLNAVVQQALDVVGVYIKKIKSFESGEDSQGYGDWSAFDDLLGAPAQVDKLLPESIYHALRRLLSNALGADVMPEDAVLIKIIQAWITTAQLYIGEGAKVWADYIGPYGQDCWGSLRDTEQTRKFTVYFFAALLEIDSSVYTDNKDLILKHWIASLVEREALLKFQHQLTATILNTDCSNPLLSNLPFWRDSEGQYLISAVELRNRRLSLISSIMSNMRESLEFSKYHGLPEWDMYKRDYNELIKHMMSTMKRNYQELGQGSNVRGVYVDFVHKVIEYLQQYAVGICPVDSFFLDPASFPLPATDPTYVVGRLKSYGFRLQDPKTAKQLLTFVQAVTERAVAEGQQEYLIDQLIAAMSTDFDIRSLARPTLRSFLLQAIFPAYIEHSTESCGAFLAMPILQALEEVFKNAGTEINAFEEATIGNTESTIFSFLEHLKASVWTIIYNPERLQDPLTLRLICSQLDVVREILPTLDYVARLHVHDAKPFLYATFFKSFIDFVTDMLRAPEDLHIPPQDEIDAIPVVDEQTSNIRFLAVTELKAALQQNWSYHDGRLYYTKRGTRVEIRTDIGNPGEEKRRFFEHAQCFHDILATTQCLDSNEGQATSGRRYYGVDSDDFLCNAWLGGLY